MRLGSSAHGSLFFSNCFASVLFEPPSQGTLYPIEAQHRTLPILALELTHWGLDKVSAFSNTMIYSVFFKKHEIFITPSVQLSWRGVYWFHLVCQSVCLSVRPSVCLSVHPSVRPSVCLSVCPSVDRIMFALYLLQYSPDPFHIYTPYQATSESMSCVTIFQNSKVWSFGKFFKFVTLTLSSFDLGSNLNYSIV